MRTEKKIAKSMIKQFGLASATEQAKESLEEAMKRDSIRDIELQYLWREILLEIMSEGAK
jgi:hypothetical protein